MSNISSRTKKNNYAPIFEVAQIIIYAAFSLFLGTKQPFIRICASS